MEQRQMSEKEVKLLGPAISMLSEEEQDEIVGGTSEMISITDAQCDKIKEFCRLEDTLMSREIMACTNYGGCCPRADFEWYRQKCDQCESDGRSV